MLTWRVIHFQSHLDSYSPTSDLSNKKTRGAMGYNTSPLSLFHPHRRWGAMNDYSIMSSTVSQHLIGFERAQGLKWRWHGKTNEEPKRNHQDPHVHRKALNLPSFVSQSRFPGYTATSTYRDEYSRGLENSACISQNWQPNLGWVSSPSICPES